MTDQDKELRRLAEAATPGPWSHLEFGSLIVDSGTGSSQNLVATVAMNTYRDRGKYTASFIAAANPATICSLLDRLESAERDAARYRWLRRYKSPKVDNLDMLIDNAIFIEGGS